MIRFIIPWSDGRRANWMKVQVSNVLHKHFCEVILTEVSVGGSILKPAIQADCFVWRKGRVPGLCRELDIRCETEWTRAYGIQDEAL